MRAGQITRGRFGRSVSGWRDQVRGDRIAALVVGALLLASCTGRFTVPPEPDPMDGVQPRCAEVGEPLRIREHPSTVSAAQLLVLRGTGGTGDYRWRIEDDGSGAQIDERAGVYIAGRPNPSQVMLDLDTVDTVVLEDRGCRGDPNPTAALTVVTAATIRPQALTVTPGRSVSFDAAGGSGDYAFALSTNRSGGSVDGAGRYTAGSEVGRDVVRLTDTVHGTTADAVVDVDSAAGLTLRPASWVVPLGTELELPIVGGSGERVVTSAGGAVMATAEGRVVAEAAGTSTVTYVDEFTQDRLDVEVRVVAPMDAPRAAPVDRLETHTVGEPADLNGDGIPDVVVGMPDGHLDALSSGRVHVFLGTERGLSLEPSVTLSGATFDEEFGYAVRIADLDQDGHADLIVGARRADPIRPNVGAVHVYGGTGDPDTIIARRPTRSFFGVNSSDLFGDSLVTCDFNGDGRLDLAVGAPFGQPAGGLNDQGVVSVYLAHPFVPGAAPEERTVFLSTPDVELVGAVPGEGGPVPVASMRLGEELAAGDFNGDGVCDLAVSGSQPGPDQRDSGFVALYLGDPADGPRRGGPRSVPTRIWARADGVDDSNLLGRSISMGDVDGDGLADLLVTRSGEDFPERRNAGVVYLIRGQALEGFATGFSDIAADAFWTVEGVNAEDRRGHDAMLTDLDGDGRADVIVADSRGSVMDSELVRPGTVNVFLGAGGPGRTPDRVFEGLRRDDRFGLGVGGVPDLDGDGFGEIVAFAPYYDSTTDDPDERGGLFVHHSSAEAPEELLLHRPATGQLVGQSVAWIRLDSDPHPELVVGSAGTHQGVVGPSTGAVRIHRGTPDGAESTPLQEISRHIGHTAFDEFGWAVSSAGDFDGDGQLDLVAVARREDIPAALDPAVFEVGPGCDARNDAGAALVFRGVGNGTVATQPSFALFGPQVAGRIESVVGDLDMNGDGLGDVVIGSREWDSTPNDNVGGVAVYFGEPAPADGRIAVRCQPDELVHGRVRAGRLGHSVALAGDLDADGCDDVLAGAPDAEAAEIRLAGEVNILFGRSLANCGSGERRVGRLLGAFRDSRAGVAVAGGVDATGDGVPDILVGANRFRDGGGEVGRVLFISGAYARGSVGPGIPMIQLGAPGQIFFDGSTAGEQLGSALTLVARPSGGAAALLGGPLGASAGRVDTGGAILVEVGVLGFGAPLLQVSGDLRGRPLLGSALATARAGGSVRFAVGAPFSSAGRDRSGQPAVDDGAAYAFSLSP